MRTNTLKAKLAAGQPVVGPLLSFNSPELVEFLGLVGFDFVLIDAEHNLVDLDPCLGLVRAADAVGLTPLVRVPRNEPTTILAYLETGAEGIVVPHVRTAEDAAAAVRAAKYAPVGRRSSASSSRAADYGLTRSAAEYFGLANEQTMVVPLVEEVEGFENLVAIGQIPGIDLLFLGDGDLAMDMGYPGQRDHPEVRRVVDEAIARGRAAGLALGGPATTAEGAAALVRAGMRLVLVPLTALFAPPARELVRQVREAT